MSAPKTLLQLAGADLAPGRLSESVVVIIDAQNEYVSCKLPLVGIGPALDRVAELLAAARSAGTPIVHVAHKGKAGGAFDPASDGFAIAPQAAPIGDEPVVEKGLPNSFAGTDLQQHLAATGRTSLILAGFMTHMCVSSTARAALDLGYRTTVVSDATATRDLPDAIGGEAVPADTIHRVALTELADRFAVVARTAEIVRA